MTCDEMTCNDCRDREKLERFFGANLGLEETATITELCVALLDNCPAVTLQLSDLVDIILEARSLRVMVETGEGVTGGVQ